MKNKWTRVCLFLGGELCGDYIGCWCMKVKTVARRKHIDENDGCRELCNTRIRCDDSPFFITHAKLRWTGVAVLVRAFHVLLKIPK